MLQIDIVVSLGIGAGFAFTATRQIEKTEKPAEPLEPGESLWARPPFSSPYFLQAVLFMAICFSPASILAFWGWTSWETMHLFTRDMAAIYMYLFCVALMVLTISGYVLARNMILAGRRYGAFLLTVIPFILMGLILTYGWDGTGYQRLFSIDKTVLAQWSDERLFSNIRAFAKTDIVPPLLAVGLLIAVPILLFTYTKNILNGYRLSDTAHENGTSMASVLAWLVFTLLVAPLLTSLVLFLLMTALGWAGILISLALLVLVLLKKGPYYRMYLALLGPEDG